MPRTRPPGKPEPGQVSLSQALTAPLGSPFVTVRLPGDGPEATVLALYRPARVAPPRFRVVVVPGSGCAGMGTVAERYFAGLLHAEVLVLHKPGVQPNDHTPPDRCPGRFVAIDALGAWQAHARAALQAAVQGGGVGPALPTLLVGISEGAELLPGLAPSVAALAGLVLIGSSGLDPQEAGGLQAQRLGQTAQWQALGRAAQASQPDQIAARPVILQGRSLRYWQDLWAWPLAQPLIDGPWPILQVWGASDALVPPEAYARFTERARQRAAPYCPHALAGADHGLQAPGVDGVQRVWAWLEQAARKASADQRGRYILNSCSGPTVK